MVDIQECDVSDVDTIDSEFSEDGDNLEYLFTENDMITYEGKIIACILIGGLFITAITCMGIFSMTSEARKQKERTLLAIN